MKDQFAHRVAPQRQALSSSSDDNGSLCRYRPARLAASDLGVTITEKYHYHRSLRSAILGACGKRMERTQTGSLRISLRALAAQKSLRELGSGRCVAAAKPDVGGRHSEAGEEKLQVAGLFWTLSERLESALNYRALVRNCPGVAPINFPNALVICA